MTLEDYQKGSRQTSIDVPIPLWIAAKQNLIEFKTALIFGINFLIADKEGLNYPDCRLAQKLARTLVLLNEKCSEIERLKNPASVVNAEKEAEDILKNAGVTNG